MQDVTASYTDLQIRLDNARALQNRVAYSTARLTVYDGASPGPLGWVFVGAARAVEWRFVWR